jgi:hypothetical protein
MPFSLQRAIPIRFFGLEYDSAEERIEFIFRQLVQKAFE